MTSQNAGYDLSWENNVRTNKLFMELIKINEAEIDDDLPPLPPPLPGLDEEI